MKGPSMKKLLLTALLVTAACQPNIPPPEPKGDLVHNLRIVDGDGKFYGTVELNPVGGGTITDAYGRVIGRVVPQ